MMMGKKARKNGENIKKLKEIGFKGNKKKISASLAHAGTTLYISLKLSFSR